VGAAALLVAGPACGSGAGPAWRSSGPGVATDASQPRLAVSLVEMVASGTTAPTASLSVTVAPPPSRGGPPWVFVDSDNDRATGMWTFQSPLSASGWDLMVDGNGQLYRHTGPPNVWGWQAVTAAGFRRVISGSRVELTIPVSVLKRSPLQVRVATEAGNDWYPAAFLPGVAFPPESARLAPVPAAGAPAPLAIYYGASPWLVRGCRSTDPVECPAQAFAEFQHVVFSAGLEEPTHPSHARAGALIREVVALDPASEVWGYVSLVGGPATAAGIRPVFYTVDDIRARAASWKAMGATGIFLDESDLCRPVLDTCAKDPGGRELEVSRARQVAAVAAIHELGMPVFANGFAVPDVLGTVDGVPSPLAGARDGRRADMYLLENLNLSAGRRPSGFDVQVGYARLELARSLAGSAGVRLAAVDTVKESAPDLDSAPPFYREGVARASAAGLDAYGFTNSSYSSAQDTATNLALPPTAPTASAARIPTASIPTACLGRPLC